MTGWKTILVAVLGFVVYALGWDQLVQYIDPQYIAIATTIVMAILRLLTNTPAFKKE